MPLFSCAPLKGRLPWTGLLAGAGVLYLVVLVFAFLLPLALWRHPHFIDTRKEQIAVALGEGVGGVIHFAGAGLALTLLYLLAIAATQRSRSRARWLLAVLFPIAFAATLIGSAPLGSKDIYHYVAEGRLLVHYGENPLVTAPNAHADDPLLTTAAPWDKIASRYGPVWAALTYLPARLGGDGFVTNLLAFKGLMALFYLVALPLLYTLGERLRGGNGPSAVVLFAWNPLVVYDMLVNAHNDMPMLALALGALLFALSRRWRLAFPVLTLSVLIKFVTGLLGPLLLVWALRDRQPGPRRALLEGLVVSILLTVAFYFPFWEGARTFDALRRGGDWVTNSPAALLVDVLDFAVQRSVAVKIVQIILLPLFVAGYGWALATARPAAGPEQLLRSSFSAFFFYILFVAWWFWPWYIIWLVVLAAPLPGRREVILAVLFSATALIGHLVYNWKELVGITFGSPWLSLVMTIAVFLVPVAYWLFSSRSGLVRRWVRLWPGWQRTWTDEALQS